MKKLTLCFGFSIAFLSVNAQDTVWLKSGKSLTGQILSFADSIVTIKVKRDTLIYKLEEIKSLRYNGPAIKGNTATPVKNSKAGNDKKKDEIEVKPVKKETK